jgi:Ca-activated chloride channel family protein
VILATDGDFNIGQTSEKELEDMITRFKQTGIYLTCLGVGMGNYKDSKLEALAKKGNGNFAYIDNLQEAQKVLVTEFTKTIYAVANNAFLKISFKPGSYPGIQADRF